MLEVKEEMENQVTSLQETTKEGNLVTSLKGMETEGNPATNPSTMLPTNQVISPNSKVQVEENPVISLNNRGLHQEENPVINLKEMG